MTDTLVISLGAASSPTPLPQAGAEGVQSILYASHFTHAMAAPDIEALVRLAMSANQGRRITGCLIATAGRFAQCIEGPADEVHALMASIGRDPRHHSVAVLRDEAVDARRFGFWTMGYAGHANYAARIIDEAVASGVIGNDRRPSEHLLALMSEFVL